MGEIERKKFKQFVDGELFDLTLYQKLLEIEEDDSLRAILSELIVIEKKHLEFWQEVTGITRPKLFFSAKVKLKLFLSLRKIFSSAATVLILEMIEIYGAKKYFSVWQEYKESPLGEKLREILREEFEHEDKAIAERVERKINVDKIRAAILGFNDGFVEISGAMGGFLAAFANYFLVGFAGFIVGLAGSISMGAATFLAARSAAEIGEMERRKKEILSQIHFGKTEFAEAPPHLPERSKGREMNGVQRTPPSPASQGTVKEVLSDRESPLSQAFYVGIFYFIAALLPVLPFLLGAENVFFPAIIGILLVLILSFFTAFFAGEGFLKRLKLNSVIIVSAILVTYSISLLARTALGISI